jgi:hypothetical protein
MFRPWLHRAAVSHEDRCATGNRCTSQRITEHVSVNTLRLIWLPSQGVQYLVDGLIREELTREGDRFRGVSVAEPNPTHFAEFPDSFSNQIAVGNRRPPDGSRHFDTGLFKPLIQSIGADSE